MGLLQISHARVDFKSDCDYGEFMYLNSDTQLTIGTNL